MNYFVTGTDTNVGKTLISCALLHGFAAQGKRVIGMKPIAAGCNDTGQSDDVQQLRAASNVQFGIDTPGNKQINPYCFVPAVAPYLAAQLAGVDIDFARIATAFTELAAQGDVVIVEGAGGLLVPLNAAQDSSDLMREMGLSVILVVGMRLGCQNHALLTVEAIAARGLTLAGWVANVTDVNMKMQDENIEILRQRISAPLLGVVPFQLQPNARKVAALLDVHLLGTTKPHD